jgi:hypothetical protein
MGLLGGDGWESCGEVGEETGTDSQCNTHCIFQSSPWLRVERCDLPMGIYIYTPHYVVRRSWMLAALDGY